MIDRRPSRRDLRRPKFDYAPKTGMFFSDAKAGLAEIIASVKSLVAS